MRIKYLPVVFLSALGMGYLSLLYLIRHPPPKVHSDLFLRGKIVSIVVSHNHAFGIYKIRIDSSNFKDTAKPADPASIPPFAVDGSWAEVYGATSVEDSVGSIIEVNGPAQTILIQRPNRQGILGERSFYAITESDNINFIRDHSAFNR